MFPRVSALFCFQEETAVIVEYPDYYESFTCLADRCPDTCCAGWDINVDDESYYRYQTVQGPFGDWLRSMLQDEGGEKSFRLTPDQRCPFLDTQNLCEIYRTLGPENLCRTCREFPRFVTQIGDYEQIDLSLACPAAANLFFQNPGMITVCRVEDERPGKNMSVSDAADLSEIISFRDTAMAGCQKHSDHPHFLNLLPESNDPVWIEQFCRMEPLEDAWTVLVKRISDRLSEYQALWPEVYSEELEQWFRKLGAYFSFRYFIDSWFDGSLLPEKLMVKKSLWFLRLMVIDRWTTQDRQFSLKDLKELVQFYSKQVEFSDPNVRLLKELPLDSEE